MSILRKWYQRIFNNAEVVVLLVCLVACFVVVATVGDLILPVLGALVISYLLDGIVVTVEKRGIPRFAGVLVVYAIFLTVYMAIIFGVVPLVYTQVSDVVRESPAIFEKTTVAIEGFVTSLRDKGDDADTPEGPPSPEPEDLPDGSPEADTPKTRLSDTAEQGKQPPTELPSQIRKYLEDKVKEFSKKLVSSAPKYLNYMVVLFVYMILLPILVFFMLKDKRRIRAWFGRFLPRERKLVGVVWNDVDRQMSNYVRGKAWEILIVGGVTYFTFTVLGLNYSLLLSLTVGFSVLVPYVGATIVTFPIAMVAFAQWGIDSNFLWAIGCYGVIQALDGNLLVPLIFSEAVNIHPVAIILAVLIFGGLWGFWGVVFAIPLATLVQAVIKAWPQGGKDARQKSPR